MEIKNKVIAMLIDAENISHKKLEPIIEKIYKYGKITVRRIYGDWTNHSMKNWNEELLKFSFRPIQKFKYTKSKNSSDIALVIDAMDILYSKNVDCFVLVSSDSDFTGLTSRIRESNLTVIGVGEKKTPEALIKSCDVFEFVDEEDEEDVVDKKLDKYVVDKRFEEFFIFLEKAYGQVANEDGWASLSQVAQACQKLDPSFNPKDYNFKGKRIKGYLELFQCLGGIYEVKQDGGSYVVRKINE